MTLSYILANLWYLPDYRPRLNAVLTPGQSLAIGAAAVVVQGILAHLWFRRFHYGPLEWLWRAATRTSFDVPFLKTRGARARLRSAARG